jgi:hypothetical protein
MFTPILRSTAAAVSPIANAIGAGIVIGGVITGFFGGIYVGVAIAQTATHGAGYLCKKLTNRFSPA